MDGFTTLSMGEMFVGYLIIGLFLPLAIAGGCLWIWFLGRMKPDFLQSIRDMCVFSFTLFQLFCLLILIIRYLVWKSGFIEFQEKPTMGSVFVVPAWIFSLFYSLYRFAGWLETRER